MLVWYWRNLLSTGCCWQLGLAVEACDLDGGSRHRPRPPLSTTPIGPPPSEAVEGAEEPPAKELACFGGEPTTPALKQADLGV